ncbi:hypothetical protein GM920_00490 [Pedobacter sp. LMG 31462]|uniref:ApeA N-terminal domain-containing protein n=2 Tax=Pedobacter gandavensis TaxID=2679963 RepID=A0ABR6EQW7_9SPHI|nr:hypothetical protein [Pedobacter gandavensis]
MDIIIEDTHNNDIGVLCFLKDKELDISTLTEYQFSALMLDIDSEVDLEQVTYRFKNNYVVIDESYIPDYILEYKNSAPIWGLFNHHLQVQVPLANTIQIPKLKALNLKNFNHENYYECSIRGIKQSYSFERYLKYYHLLELNFDYDVIKRVKALDVHTESNAIGKLLKGYEDDDVSRLLHLFDTYCLDVDPIVIALNRVRGFQTISEDMFYTFGKNNSNPMKELSNFQRFVNSSDGFSFANCQLYLGNKRIGDTAAYRTFIGKLSIYWIYRIRCSIAHNKIGEYLLSARHENYLSEFAFPLLKEITIQCFK